MKQPATRRLDGSGINSALLTFGNLGEITAFADTYPAFVTETILDE
jgi:hypothetical protein